MIELRRSKAGSFDEKDAITLYQLQEAYEKYKNGDDSLLLKYMQPIELMTKLLQTFEVKDDSVKRILTGSPVFKGFLKNEEKTKDLKVGCYIALTHKNKLVGIERIVHEGTTIAVPEMIVN